MIIEKIIEAYEVKTSSKKSFKQKIRELGRILEVLFYVLIVCGAVLLVWLFFSQSPLLYTLVLVYIIIVHIVTHIIECKQHSRWEINIKEYNKDLDLISDILKAPDFKLYEKNKIKQLIKKSKNSIQEQKQKKESKTNDIKDFLVTYILPIIAFFSGKISVVNTDTSSLFAMGIGLVLIVIGGKKLITSIMELVSMISWNRLEKEENLCKKLQDLLDRDFVIEKDDLLELK